MHLNFSTLLYSTVVNKIVETNEEIYYNVYVIRLLIENKVSFMYCSLTIEGPCTK